MINPIHIDLTGPELQRIVTATEFIAKNETQLSVRSIKNKLDLTDAEYEILLTIALPQIRALGAARQWKRLYTNLVRKLAEATTPPSERPPKKRRVMDWSEDPVIRLEKLRKLIKERYDELYSTSRLEDLLRAHMFDYDDDEEDDGV